MAQPHGIRIEVDEFTGDSSLVSDWVKFNDPVWKSGPLCHFTLIKSEDQIALGVKVTSKDQVALVEEGADLMILTGKGTLVTLQALSNEVASIGGGSIGLRSSSVWGLTILYGIDLERMQQIADEGIAKVRVYTSDRLIEVEPEKDKWARDVQSLFVTFAKFLEAV